MSEKNPSSVLFVCFLNSIRSPMAEGLCKNLYGADIYVQSCGLQTGELDDLMVAVMREKSIDLSTHQAQKLSDLSRSGPCRLPKYRNLNSKKCWLRLNARRHLSCLLPINGPGSV